MITNELPSGGHDQLLVDIRLCLAANQTAAAQLGSGRTFLVGELDPLVQYGAEHGEDANPLHHLIVAIGAAGLNGNSPHYRLSLVRFDTNSDESDTGYVTIQEDIFHTDNYSDGRADFDEGDANDWRSRLDAARYSAEASWFHVSSDDESDVIQAANRGDEEAQVQLGFHQVRESRRRLEEWRDRQQFISGHKERAVDYDY